MTHRTRTHSPTPQLLCVWWLLCTILWSPLYAATAEEQTELFSSTGYRIAAYLAPTPDHLAGAITITTEQLQRLLSEPDLILIDVFPAPIKPPDYSPQLWLPPARNNIPGSFWLANAGMGYLPENLEKYFRLNLLELSAGDKSKKIVIYCQADCWMSWNAARRGVEFGYTSIYWYPDGTTGWSAHGLPLEKSVPIPLHQPHTTTSN